MNRYTLKTFSGSDILETYLHRSAGKMADILRQDKFYRSGETGPFGEKVPHPDNFIIVNSMMEVIHSGDIAETLVFLKKLR